MEGPKAAGSTSQCTLPQIKHGPIYGATVSRYTDGLYSKCMSAYCFSRQLNEEHSASWKQAVSGPKQQPKVVQMMCAGSLRGSGRCVIHISFS